MCRIRIVLYCFLSLFSISGASGIEVLTSHGKVSGKLFRTLVEKVEYSGFMGIPYAAPPINGLRFLPPQPVKPWDGTLDATTEKPACIQFNINVKKGKPLGQYGTEDCLYLDVFTPSTEDKRYPVLVFLHNIDFRNSYNKTKDYGPDFFIEEQLIVVTVAHRLSVFGFMTFEDDTLPSNAGLKDIVKSLEWIQENIAAFGGDTSRVTLLGSQGGGAAIDLLLNSNARHLFHSVILQSGTSWTSKYLQESARDRALRLAETLEIRTSGSQSLLEELQAISPDKLLQKNLNALPEDYFKEQQKQILPFGPVIEQEGGLLTGYYEDNLKTIDVPIMIGFNSLEGLEAALQYIIDPRPLSFLEVDFPFHLPRRVKFRFDPLESEFYDAVEEIKAIYFSQSKISVERPSEYVTYLSDTLTAYAVDYTARRYVNISTSNVYYYYFDYVGDLNENKINLQKLLNIPAEDLRGAAAGDELCYLFKCPDLLAKYVRNDNVESSNNIQRKLVQMWANFVKSGKPTPDGDMTSCGIRWNPYNTETKEYLHIGDNTEMRRDLNKDRFGFWDRFIETWGRKAKDGIIISKRILRTGDEL